jgi:hypothetical protein
MAHGWNRNQPRPQKRCWCGSGKKQKNCHGKSSAPQAQPSTTRPHLREITPIPQVTMHPWGVPGEEHKIVVAMIRKGDIGPPRPQPFPWPLLPPGFFHAIDDSSVPAECQISFVGDIPETHVCRGSNWVGNLGIVGTGTVKGFGLITGIKVTARGYGGLTQTTGPATEPFQGIASAWQVPFRFVRPGQTGELAHILWSVSYQCEGTLYTVGHLSNAVVCE